MLRQKYNLSAMGFSLICLVYTFFFSQMHILNGVEYIPFQKLVRGRAPTPFQYRVLVPWLAGKVHNILDHYSLVEDLEQVKYLFEYGFVLALFGVFVYASPYLVLNDPNTGLKTRSLVRVVSGCLLMLTLPFHFIIPTTVYYYPYDISSILFFVLGLVFLRLEKWGAFLVVFVIGTFNRETTIFLSFIYLLTNWKNTPRARLMGYFLLQIALWLAVKYLLFLAFQNNTAESVWYADAMGIFKNTWNDNLKVLLMPQTYPRLFSAYGYLWLPLLPVWRHIRGKWIKSALLIIPVYHLSMLIPGHVEELRIYGEMLPLVLLGIMAGMVSNEKWIQEANREETRQGRIEKAMEMPQKGQKGN
ncbi:MAG: YdeI/OmpD-associated family protein [Anaerolineales bacterium]|jgi:hypothetical protein|nr:YdeI/OmpD-associated family protein [Anaerolineales bacterium]